MKCDEGANVLSFSYLFRKYEKLSNKFNSNNDKNTIGNTYKINFEAAILFSGCKICKKNKNYKVKATTFKCTINFIWKFYFDKKRIVKVL